MKLMKCLRDPLAMGAGIVWMKPTENDAVTLLRTQHWDGPGASHGWYRRDIARLYTAVANIRNGLLVSQFRQRRYS